MNPYSCITIITLFLATALQGEENSLLDQQFKARQIIAHKCWKCHGSERDEGDLRMHTRQHILDSGIVNLKSPELSELLKRVHLPEGHDDIMPQESDPLKKEEIEILTGWIRNGMKWDGRGAFKEAPIALRKVAPIKNSRFKHLVDQQVDSYFKKHQITWRPVIDDHTFIRKAYLDSIGLLPTPAQTQQFLNDTDPKKRTKLITHLLNQNVAYQQHWLSFWNDLLRNDYTGTGFITKGRSQITKWINNSLIRNKPYDTMVRELFSNKKDSAGFIAGISWRGTVSASQTVEMQAAQNSAQAFLGVNIKCASCHDAFTSNWKLQQSHQFASIFSKKGSIEIHRCDKPTGKLATPGFLFPELGKLTPTAPLPKRLEQLGSLMTAKKNGRFARTIVNRYWKLLLGRGIVFQPDEMDTTPWSQEVLDDLAFRFVEQGFDLKWLIKEIMTSQAYQLPIAKVESRHALASDSYRFRGPVIRRVTAEQFSDMISTTVTPIYGKHKNGQLKRASQLPRDPFQTALGRPTRENVTSSREDRGNLLESLELTNGSVLDTALKSAAANAQKQYKTNAEAFIQDLFLKGLQRQPTAKELHLLKSIYQTNPSALAYHDILWIFINLPEFQSIL